jgi:hypothetical protein
MSYQFGPKITKQDYTTAMKKLDSMKAAFELFEFYYEEFDIFIDYRVGIYIPDELRAKLQASYRKMKEAHLSIDEQFERMEIDSEDYRWEFGQAVKQLVIEVNAVLSFELFPASTYKYLLT